MACSVSENFMIPGLKSGLGASGEPGRKNRSKNETDMVNNPSTIVELVFSLLEMSEIRTQEKPLPPLETVSSCQFQDS
jgi:hypothetical protein